MLGYNSQEGTQAEDAIMENIENQTSSPIPSPSAEFHESSDRTNELSSGRQFVETRLRHKVYVDQFPSRTAGTPINGSNRQNASAGFQEYGTQVADEESNTYAQFKSQLDWEIARWAKLRGPSSTALSELLSIAGVQEALGLSFKNARELNNVIDTQLPSVRP